MRFLISTFIIICVFSTSVFAGEIVIVANQSYPSDSITVAMAKSIYFGKRRKEGSTTIHPIDLPDAEKTKADFIKKVLGLRSTTKYNSYWIGKMFKEGGVPPVIKDSVEDMLNEVANNKGAIGYCEKDQVKSTSNVKILLTVN